MRDEEAEAMKIMVDHDRRPPARQIYKLLAERAILREAIEKCLEYKYLDPTVEMALTVTLRKADSA